MIDLLLLNPSSPLKLSSSSCIYASNKMPRPGPRAYECLRRAWHSDSHQPLRGCIIQEIFRVINELHSPSIRKKKAWQDKVLIVVLRAEEILYSKATSENEYVDTKTLRDRLDDAVDTIIRRKEAEENDSGPYLQPCVEAALSLSCFPMKGSRGKQHQFPRYCADGSRKPNNTSYVGHVLTPVSGSNLSNSSSNNQSPFSSNHGLSQETATLSVLMSKQRSCQASVFCTPISTESDRNSLTLHGSDGQFTLPPSGDFLGVAEICVPVTGPSFLNPSLLHFLETSKSGAHEHLPADQRLHPAYEILQSVRLDADLKMDLATRGACPSLLMNPVVPSLSSMVCSSCVQGLGAPDYVDSGSHSYFQKDSSLKIQMPQSASEQRCLNGTSSQTGELQSSCKNFPCSSRKRKSRNASSSILISLENDCESSCIETYDLELRLGPPGIEQKLNYTGDTFKESFAACSSAVTPCTICCREQG